MTDLLEVAFDKSNVEAIVTGGLAKSIGRVSLMAFKEPKFRANLIKDIVYGVYRVKPPHVSKIPKDNGKWREIYVNTDIDRLLLALANRAYIQIYGDKLSKSAKAYLPGCSTARAVKELVVYDWSTGYKLDLSKYFDSVPKEILYKVLDEINTGSPLDKVVSDYYKDDTVIIDKEPVQRYKSLAQGCAVSTFLANYVLRHIDIEMESSCSYYARYSDDIVIFDSDISKLESMLSDLGLSLNPAKVEKLERNKEFTFLGYGIKGNDILVSQKHFTEIKKSVKSACKKAKNLKSMIKRVQQVLLYPQEPFYGWLYRQSCVTDFDRIVELDNYCKDCIRATITGSWNYTHNVHVLPNTAFEEAGWQPLVHLLTMAKLSKALYYEEVRNI